MRADLLLVERGFYESRARAQAAIAAGLVSADGARVPKSSASIVKTAVIEALAEHPYVSRGGMKLAAALDSFGIDPFGRFCLDVGASTGGFTDVLLQRNARHVVAVDVGHDQFHASLWGEPRVTLLEGKDARDLAPSDLGEAPSLVVIDVSFISLSLVLPCVLPLAASRACLIALVKPQFEVGRALVLKGIVRDETARLASAERVMALVNAAGWTVRGPIESPISGGDGNIEYLIAAERAA